MADDGYVAIHRTTDVADGELLAEMLRREGIAARFHRVSSSLIGVPMFVIEMTVDVPVESEARARAVLADLEYVGAEDAATPEEAKGEGAGGDEADAVEPGEPAVSARKPVLAAGFAFFVPGGAHLYARRPWTTLVLTLGVLVGFAIAVVTRGAFLLELAVSIWLAVIGCDAIAGMRAVRAGTRGEQLLPGAQLSRGVRLLGLAIVIGAGARLVTAAPRLVRTWQLAKYRVSAAGRTITVENRDDRGHLVEISDIKVRGYSYVSPPQLYAAGPAHPVEISLAPGGSGAMAVEVGAGLAWGCYFSNAPEWPPPFATRLVACGFSFAFTVRDVGAAAGDAIEAVGNCIPAFGWGSGMSNEPTCSLTLVR